MVQHEIKVVKGTSKTYKTKKDGKKESVSKRIDLGVKSLYAVGDEVVILSIDDFNKLTESTSDEIQVLKNIIADKDAIIDKKSARNDTLNKELHAKLDLINKLTKDLKASEKKVSDLESDVSTKDNIIADNKKAIDGKDAEITDLNDNITKISAGVDTAKQLLLSKDGTIADLEKEIAKYDAIDIDKLNEKADELDKSKNIIIKLQNEMQILKDAIAEYKLLVDYKDNSITAIQKQGLIAKLLNKDAIADIKEPALKHIDLSGDMIADNLIDTVGKDDSADDSKQN